MNCGNCGSDSHAVCHPNLDPHSRAALQFEMNEAAPVHFHDPDKHESLKGVDVPVEGKHYDVVTRHEAHALTGKDYHGNVTGAHASDSTLAAQQQRQIEILKAQVAKLTALAGLDASRAQVAGTAEAKNAPGA